MATQSGNPPALNATGKVMTVKGPIDPDRLGYTIMHEHLFLDLRKWAAPDESGPVTETAIWDQKLTLENLHLARSSRAVGEDYLLNDEQLAADEAMEFGRWGGGTIVEVTSIGLRRDPASMLNVSNVTGLNVVMGTGWYQKLFHPPDMDQRTVEDLADEIVRDITVGVGDTGIRSGIIGEVGVQGEPIEPNEVKSIRASARASRVTGAAISFHRGGADRDEKLQVVGVLGEEGADLSRVVFGHSDPMAGDMPLMLELLGHGVYIQFDLLGRVNVSLEWKPPSYRGEDMWTFGMTALVADAIPKLIAEGYADRILLSHDVCTRVQLKRYGGTGYSFIPEVFLPHLRNRGVEEEHIQQMMVENPKRVLTLADPIP
jgi:phosphotriesterase-related protein